MRSSVIIMGVAATALAAAAVSSTVPVAKGADKLKVGFIYLGPIGDGYERVPRSELPESLP